MQRRQVLGRTSVAASNSGSPRDPDPARWSEPRTKPGEAHRGLRLFGGPLTDEVAPLLQQTIHLSVSLGGGCLRAAAFGYPLREQH